MNTVLVLVMLVLVIFALKEGMVWVALGIGLVMVLISTSEGGASSTKQAFTYQSPDQGAITEDMKQQMLKVKYSGQWDGNNWWEEIGDHWGTAIGRGIGFLR